MFASWLAAPLATATVAILFVVNRKVWGCLPDDPPRPGRKQHRQPVPLAGIALLPVIVGYLLAARSWWLGGAAALAAVVGFLDDRGKEHGADLDWRWKALCLLAGSLAIAWATTPEPMAHPTRFAVATVLAFVLINATNFLDNLDGVATLLAATSLLLATTCFGEARPEHVALAAAGFAALGFLPWNWPRPWLFLGDSGAYLLGACIAAVATQRLHDPLRAVAPVAVQLVDFVQVVVARVVLGLPPWVGDRRHLTHIALHRGVPRTLIAPLFAAAAIGAFALLRQP